MPSGRDSFRRNRVAPSVPIIPLGWTGGACYLGRESWIELTVDSLQFTVEEKNGTETEGTSVGGLSVFSGQCSGSGTGGNRGQLDRQPFAAPAC